MWENQMPYDPSNDVRIKQAQAREQNEARRAAARAKEQAIASKNAGKKAFSNKETLGRITGRMPRD